MAKLERKKIPLSRFVRTIDDRSPVNLDDFLREIEEKKQQILFKESGVENFSLLFETERGYITLELHAERDETNNEVSYRLMREREERSQTQIEEINMLNWLKHKYEGTEEPKTINPFTGMTREQLAVARLKSQATITATTEETSE